MVILTRPTGERFALNPDLIERVEQRHYTTVTLVDGATYLVAESVETVAERMLAYRQAVIAGPSKAVGHLRLAE